MYHRKACISVSEWYPLWKWACSVVPHVQLNTSDHRARRNNMLLVCCWTTSCWLMMVSGLLWSIATSYILLKSFSISFSFFFSCSINLFSIFLFFLFIRITNSLWRMKLVWLYESTPIVPQMCVCDSLRTFTLCTLCSGLTWPLTENHFSPLEMKEMCGDGETSHCQSAIIWKKRRNVGWEC